MLNFINENNETKKYKIDEKARNRTDYIKSNESNLVLN